MKIKSNNNGFSLIGLMAIITVALFAVIILNDVMSDKSHNNIPQKTQEEKCIEKKGFYSFSSWSGDHCDIKKYDYCIRKMNDMPFKDISDTWATSTNNADQMSKSINDAMKTCLDNDK